MGKHYYYEVDYRCTCEVCGKTIGGVIRRGPLEYNKDGILPTGMDSAKLFRFRFQQQFRFRKRLNIGNINGEHSVLEVFKGLNQGVHAIGEGILEIQELFRGIFIEDMRSSIRSFS